MPTDRQGYRGRRTGLCMRPLQAGDRARTGDPQLGKLMLYQLSYTRESPQG